MQDVKPRAGNERERDTALAQERGNGYRSSTLDLVGGAFSYRPRRQSAHLEIRMRSARDKT